MQKSWYREHPAYKDENKRHISALRNDGSILKTVPERVFAPILYLLCVVMAKPILRSLTSYVNHEIWNEENLRLGCVINRS